MCVFLGKATNYSVKVNLFCNVRLNTEHSQVVQKILTHGGSEIILDKLMLVEAHFC